MSQHGAGVCVDQAQLDKPTDGAGVALEKKKYTTMIHPSGFMEDVSEHIARLTTSNALIQWFSNFLGWGPHK